MNPTSTLLTVLATLQVGQTENQFVRAILDSGPFARVILVIITFFSVVSWAIILHKSWQYRQIRRENDSFLDDFNRYGGDFGSLCQIADRLTAGTLPQLFSESYRELRAVGRVHDRQILFDRSHISIVQKRMERVVGQQIVRLEKYIMFLASTANVCPLLGLLGTVWGVLGTFMAMADIQTSLTLKVIGPGISEALAATVFGLAAAIPAAVAYNALVNRVGVFRMEMEDFAIRLLAVLEKNILARSAPEPPLTTSEFREEVGLALSQKVSVQ